MVNSTLDPILEGRRSQPHQLIEVLQDVQDTYGYISEDTIKIGNLWKQYFREAHELTKDVYPKEDVNSDRFGMSRQTVLNQLVHLAGVVVAKQNSLD